MADRLTTRERRERRAERLEEWAAAREARQAALSDAARADEATTGIPFGQPILVGHHSERRHRNALARVDRAMAASVDNSRKVESMNSRAETIRAQADAAIYSDDPDVIERLTEKLAALEAKRDAMKARNSEFRKAHKAELKAMTAYERSQAVPFPSYSIQNIGGVISTTRKRLTQAQREAEHGPRDRTIMARFDSTCEECGAPLTEGSTIRYNRSQGARCAPECGATTEEE